MQSAQKIRDKCEKDIRELQKACKHAKSYWVMKPAFLIIDSEMSLKICANCDKILETEKGTCFLEKINIDSKSN